MSSELKNVIVIGLGLAGAGAIQLLEPQLPASHRIVAISTFPYGFHQIAALRGCVLPGWEENINVPLDHLFKAERHVLLAGTSVSGLTKTHVRVDRSDLARSAGLDDEIPYDILVIATGSNYAFPCRPPPDADNVANLHDSLRTLQGEVKDCKSVLCIGGGAVSVEFAGEVAAAYPDKKVTLVSAHEWLHAGQFKPNYQRWLKSQLQALKVDVVLGQRVTYDGKKSGKITPQTFNLGEGKTVEADFVLLGTGNSYNGALAKALSPDLVTEKNQIRIKPTLQVDSSDSSLARIFATGDVSVLASGADEQTWHSAHQKAGVIAKNVVALIQGKPLKTWSPPGVFAFVAIGPSGGVGQVFGIVLGGWLTKFAKSSHLLVPYCFPEWGAKDPKNKARNTL